VKILAAFSASLLILLNFSVPAAADGPADNIPASVRPIPPAGLDLEEGVKDELLNECGRLEELIGQLKKRKDARTPRLLPDVEIFARAVRQNVEHGELFSPGDVKAAKSVLAEGIRRAESLLDGKAPWTTQTGLVVRGYRSKIDQTVQPYGLEIPHDYSFGQKDRVRLDLWFHGRGEKVTETPFINQRMTKAGQYQPENTIVLHPFGRYCNAFKLAGEIDVLEALEHAKENYRIDENRIAVRGFSMGGAGCWQMAVHYPGMFFAANPGAGFSETPEFLKIFQQEDLKPTWYEQKLWRMYDCPGYAVNLYQLPTIAYSGELDIQKQAADIMEAALKKEQLRLTHIIGPETKHSIHADSKEIISAKLDSLSAQVTPQPSRTLWFSTYTLRYNEVEWLTLTGMEEHWEQAEVKVHLVPEESLIELTQTGVTGLKLSFDAGECPFEPNRNVTLVLQSRGPRGGTIQRLTLERPETDRSWSVELHRSGREWKSGPIPAEGLRKTPGLQGPIDDAFMDSFVIVAPTGKSWNEKAGAWAKAEQERAIAEWRRQFRGDAIVVKDSELTEEQIRNSNLILFGDPSSNSYLGKVLDRLPLQWTKETVTMKGQSTSAANHAPVLIYPNPENPERYVVLNSGFTYREYAYLNNARQVPKLPDWAVINLDTEPNALWPGQVVEAAFFDEEWKP